MNELQEISSNYALDISVHILTFFFLISFSVSGGISSLVQGSYEYYHYLQNGYDDSVMDFLPTISFLIAAFNMFIAVTIFCILSKQTNYVQYC